MQSLSGHAKRGERERERENASITTFIHKHSVFYFHNEEAFLI